MKKQNTNPKKNNIRHPLLAYWRNTLSDEHRVGLTHRKIKDAVELSYNDNLEEGRLTHNTVDALFKKVTNETASNQKNRKRAQEDLKQNQEISAISVIISPFYGKRSFSHGTQWTTGQKFVYPLWFTATLHQNGELMPDEPESLPWIDRHS